MTPKPTSSRSSSGITAEGALFYGDNLPILRERIPDESVDLVYADDKPDQPKLTL
jgi:hypothetical protein